jgi:hypothetical protein
MHTVNDLAEVESIATIEMKDNVTTTITTTLYNLIAAIQEVVDPADDALVVATVWHVLCSGRVTWHGDVVARVN